MICVFNIRTTPQYSLCNILYIMGQQYSIIGRISNIKSSSNKGTLYTFNYTNNTITEQRGEYVCKLFDILLDINHTILIVKNTIDNYVYIMSHKEYKGICIGTLNDNKLVFAKCNIIVETPHKIHIKIVNNLQIIIPESNDYSNRYYIVKLCIMNCIATKNTYCIVSYISQITSNHHERFMRINVSPYNAYFPLQEKLPWLATMQPNYLCAYIPDAADD